MNSYQMVLHRPVETACDFRMFLKPMDGGVAHSQSRRPAPLCPERSRRAGVERLSAERLNCLPPATSTNSPHLALTKNLPYLPRTRIQALRGDQHGSRSGNC